MSLLEFIPPVIAHRGASGYAPENTMAAFQKALELNISWIEFDVMLAKTGEVIVFHDNTLDRTTNGHGKVKNLTFEELRKLDAGSWFDPDFSREAIPTLQEVLQFLPYLKMNIELKPLPGQTELLVHTVSKLVKQLPLSSNILFSSFNIDALKALRDSYPNACIGLLLDKWRWDWEKICRNLNCISVHLNYKILSAARAEAIKQTNRKLLCYTVNDSDLAKSLFSMGVDAVFSDVPDRILNSK